jgi:hypothetical protein
MSYELNVREAAAKGAQDLRKAVGKDAFWRADAQRAAWFGAGLDGALALFHGGKGLAGEGQEVAAGIGEGDAAPEAVKERHAELLFQRFDLGGDVGLNGVHFFGGAREVQLFGEGAKDLQLTDFHCVISNSD